MLPRYKLISFDIINLYTNIPILETIDILRTVLIRTAILNIQQINELLSVLKILLLQNYFTYDGKFFIQEEGLAMASPLSGLLAEVYLNFYENKYLLSTNNTLSKNIISYTRYVDDTFIVFDGTDRQIDKLLSYMNGLNSKIKFTMELECNGCLNFLDLSVRKENNSLTYKVYRKPTTTDMVINAHSYHPETQKLAPFNAFIHRLLSIPLCSNDYQEEINTIKYIAINLSLIHIYTFT